MTATQTAPDRSASTPPRIFIVEDEAMVAMELKDILREMGFDVCGHAAKGEPGVEGVLRASPDLVLLDINLGRGLDGFGVAERLQRETDVPIVFLTAYTDETVTQRAMQTSSYGFLTKPFQRNVLRANIELVLRRRQAELDLQAAHQRLEEASATLQHLSSGISQLQGRSFFDTMARDLARALDVELVTIVQVKTPMRRASIRGCSLLLDDTVRELSYTEHCSTDMWHTMAMPFVHVADADQLATAPLLKRIAAQEMVSVSISDAQGQPSVAMSAASSTTVGDVDRCATLLHMYAMRARAELVREDLERRLTRTQRLETVGTLAGGVAHDFNNLLLVIMANADMARMDVGDVDDDTAESFDAIAAACRRAQDLVKQLLSFTSPQAAPRTVRLSDVVDEARQLTTRLLPHTPIVVDEHGPVAVSGDAALLRQAVLHLLQNACQASAPGDEVRVVIDDVDAADVRHLLPDATGRYGRIRVVDQGVGIDADHHDRIFEPFFTTRGVGEGAGLGLSVVHGVMRSHQGAVDVDSVAGEGAEFVLVFPAAAAKGDN